MSVLAFDVETEGLHHTAGLTTISFTSANKSVAFAVNHPEQKHTERDALNKIQRVIDKTDVLIAHRAHFDIKHLLNAGINLEGKKFICTKILYWLYTGHRAKQTGLNHIAKILLNEEKEDGYDFSKKKASEYPLDGLLKYNKQDTKLTFKLYEKLVRHIPSGLIDFYSDMSYFLARKEMSGMYVDLDILAEERGNMEARISVLEKELLYGLEYPINIGAPQQLSCALYGGTFKTITKETVRERFKTWPLWRWKNRNIEKEITLKGLGFGTSKLELTKDGYYPTNKDVILGLKGRSKKAKEWLETYKVWNDLTTLHSKELKNLESKMYGDTLHSNYHAIGTQTGRISSSGNRDRKKNANLQQRQIRNIFTSRFPDGKIVAVDFSGIQWRIAAMFSQDPKMIADILEGLDPHKVTASDVFNLNYDEIDDKKKKPAKAVNFGILFGKTKWGYAKDPKLELIPDIETAEQFIKGVFKSRPKLRGEIDRSIAIASGRGRIDMENGRWYDFKGDYFKETTIFNYRVQGREADIAFPCYIEADNQVRNIIGDDGALVVNTVHDEIVFDCRTEEIGMEVIKIARNIFTNAAKYVNMYFPEIDLSSVPIDCDAEIGDNWGNMTKVE